MSISAMESCVTLLAIIHDTIAFKDDNTSKMIGTLLPGGDKGSGGPLG
jgi:DTW domain-containing protein YfiP